MKPRSRALAMIALALLTLAARHATAQESVITSFNTVTTDVALPQGDLMMDAKGNIYGTAYNYGTNIEGGVWELSPNGDGSWTHTVLYAFGPSGTDLGRPVDNVVMDAIGNLYGVTSQGGANSKGGVFQLSPPITKGGAWTETILHSFANDGTDGYLPYSGLVIDAKGNLYGNTQGGGADNYGVVYELTPPTTKGGAWTETIVHSFAGDNKDDGSSPAGRMLIDSAGNLYGTTIGGGTLGEGDSGGTLFKLTASSGNTFSYSILYTWNSGGAAGSYPGDFLGVVNMDSAGNFYGTSYSGGANSEGTVWEIAKSGNTYTGEILYSFFAYEGDGLQPYGGVNILGGNLYCTVTHGGANSSGAVIELTPKSGGGWTETLFHNFGGTQGDGGVPYAGMLQDANGDLFGTTTYGGTYGGGEVFEIAGKPAASTALVVTPTTLTVGQNVNFKATVTGASGTPTGSVTFSSEGVKLATVPLNGSGIASLTASSNGYAPATYPILATYSGGSTYSGSVSAAVNAELEKAPTATAFTASPTSVTRPGSVTLTATVTRSTSGATGTPTGSVTFYADGSDALVTVKLNSNGVAKITATTKSYPAGKYAVTAKYLGDSSDTTSTSAAVDVTLK